MMGSRFDSAESRRRCGSRRLLPGVWLFLLLAVVSGQHQCFETGDELKEAVDNYLSNDAEGREAVRETYGDAIGDWCVDKVKDFSLVFSPFRHQENGFDSSQATALSNFNEPLDGWNTSNAESMNGMFLLAASFGRSVDHFVVDKVIDFNYMFYAANSFNKPLSSWNTISAETMYGMFAAEPSADGTDLNPTFNQPLNHLDVDNVFEFGQMFSGATAFNQPLHEWNTASAQSMFAMFERTLEFNRPLYMWNVSGVFDFSFMFFDSKAFHQNLCPWSEQIQATANVFLMFAQAYSCPRQESPNLNAMSPVGPFCIDCDTAPCFKHIRTITNKCTCQFFRDFDGPGCERKRRQPKKWECIEHTKGPAFKAGLECECRRKQGSKCAHSLIRVKCANGIPFGRTKKKSPERKEYLKSLNRRYVKMLDDYHSKWIIEECFDTLRQKDFEKAEKRGDGVDRRQLTIADPRYADCPKSRYRFECLEYMRSLRTAQSPSAEQ